MFSRFNLGVRMFGAFFVVLLYYTVLFVWLFRRLRGISHHLALVEEGDTAWAVAASEALLSQANILFVGLLLGFAVTVVTAALTLLSIAAPLNRAVTNMMVALARHEACVSKNTEGAHREQLLEGARTLKECLVDIMALITGQGSKLQEDYLAVGPPPPPKNQDSQD